MVFEGNKKILHVVNNLSFGGTTGVILQILPLNNLRSNNEYYYEIINISGKASASVLHELNAFQIPHHNLKYTFQKRYDSLSYLLKAFFPVFSFYKNKRIIKKIIEINPDVLHFHTLPSELMIGKKVQKKIPCKLVYTDHSSRVNKDEVGKVSLFLLKIAFKQFYKNYHLVSVSKAVDRYTKLLGLEKVTLSNRIIYNKVSHTDKYINYYHKEEYVVVYISRIAPTKGHKDLIDAWELLPPHNLHLKIYGPDEMNGKIHSYIKSKVFRNKVSIDGPSSDVSSILLTADIGVFPSYKEGLPIALLEKMQVGLPCVVSDIPEILDIVTHEQDGLIFKLGSATDLANKIILLASDINLRKKIGSNARKLVLNNYTNYNGLLRKEYEELYNQILN